MRKRLGFTRSELASKKVEEEEIEKKDDEDGELYSLLELDLPKAAARKTKCFHRRSFSLVYSLPFANNIRRSFCYDRLHQFPLYLTVVKLDGSCFGIEVDKCGRVAELKQAVEGAFSHLPRKGPDKISWEQVWGHFCMSYNGCKLLDDDKIIKDYRMTDGDELHFTRHVSAAYKWTKKKSAKHADVPRLCGLLENREGRPQTQRAEEEERDHLENLKCARSRQNDIEEEYDVKIGAEQPFVAQLCKKWLLCTKLERNSEKPTPSNSSLAKGLMGCFKSVFGYSTSKAAGSSSRVITRD